MSEQQTSPNVLPSDRCPSLAELEDYLRNGNDIVDRHLASCRRCRARVELLTLGPFDGDDSPAGIPESLPLAAKRPRPVSVGTETELVLGSVCSVASDERPGERLVGVILSRGESTEGSSQLTFAPVSLARDQAAEWDLVVSAERSPLRYEHVVETWNYGRISRAQVDESFGRLAPAAVKDLRKLWQANLDGLAAPDSLPTGAPVHGLDDPRLDFQRDEAERARPFYTPWVTEVAELRSGFVEELQNAVHAAGADVIDLAARARLRVELVEQLVIGRILAVVPEPEELGRLCQVVHLNISAGTIAGAGLEKDAARWTEQAYEPALAAARRDAGWLHRPLSLVARVVRRNAVDHDRALAEYLERARASAATPIS